MQDTNMDSAVERLVAILMGKGYSKEDINNLFVNFTVPESIPRLLELIYNESTVRTFIKFFEDYELSSEFVGFISKFLNDAEFGKTFKFNLTLDSSADELVQYLEYDLSWIMLELELEAQKDYDNKQIY